MELSGTIKAIFDEQQITEKFRKREFVIRSNEEYPQDIKIEVVNDLCPILDNFKMGDFVKIGINIRGREWINPEGEAKYFNSIQGWRIDPMVAEGSESYQDRESQSMNKKDLAGSTGLTGEMSNAFNQDGEDDDLPF